MKTLLSPFIVFIFFFFTGHAYADSTGQINAVNSEATTQAAWQKRELKFWYNGSNTYYSCEAIEQKLEALLKHFGAKEKPSVRASACLSGPRNTPQTISISMKFSVPVELKNSDNSTESFSAQIKPVSVSNNRPRLIESFDCELIDSFARQVLPSFEHEIVRKTTACFKRQPLHAWRLEANVLVPSTS